MVNLLWERIEQIGAQHMTTIVIESGEDSFLSKHGIISLRRYCTTSRRGEQVVGHQATKRIAGVLGFDWTRFYEEGKA